MSKERKVKGGGDKQTSVEQSVTAPSNEVAAQPQQNPAPEIQNVQQEPKDTLEISTKLEKAKKQNGLIEKAADFIKCKTGLGLSSKKIQEKIDSGIDEKEISKDIKNYRRQQENTAQSVADIFSSLGAMSLFFGLKQKAQLLIGQYYKVDEDKLKGILSNKKLEKYVSEDIKYINKFSNVLDKKITVVGIAALSAMFLGGFIKSTLLKANRIGTKQYKPEITDDMNKDEIKEAKKLAGKEKRNANRRNYITGAINGLTTPIITLGGGLGSVLYVAGNSLSRYFIGTREDKGDKDFNSYIENLKNSKIINSVCALAICIPAFIKGKGDKIFENNLNKAIEKLKKANLEVEEIQSSYEKLESTLFEDEKIASIMNDSTLGVSEKIKRLEEENIFALKFKQINSNSDELSKALKTDCPSTRTLDEAQTFIDGAFGGGEYKIKKQVGVGTIAESYLVEDRAGKSAVVKILKKGINLEKIQQDEQKFIEMIQNNPKYSAEQKEFLIKNLRNISQGVQNEVDFHNEMEAAKRLAKSTTKARVVVPIKVSDNGSAYVMEKAEGTSLQDYLTYVRNWEYKGMSQDELSNRLSEFDSKIAEYTQMLKQYESAKKRLAEIQEGLPDMDYYNCRRYLDDEATKEYRKLLDSMESVEMWYDYYFDEKYESHSFKGIDAVKLSLKKAVDGKKDLEKYIALAQESFDDITVDQAQTLLEKYQEVLIEQFSKVEPGGKTIHGDIHPGNIFIDFKALKEGKKDFFTLIDTGNVVEQDPKTALRFLNLTKYIKDADYERIADFVLEGAKLPEGKDIKWAKEEIIKGLKGAFFDDKTYLGPITNDNVLKITDGIMEKLQIIPSDTQGNLLKSKKSSENSLKEFQETFGKALGKMLEGLIDKPDGESLSAKDMVSGGMQVAKRLAKVEAEYKTKKSLREFKNLLKMPLSERAKIKRSGSAPKKNSEDYLTYKIKTRLFDIGKEIGNIEARAAQVAEEA